KPPPVTSPMAQTRSVPRTRRWSSTSSHLAFSSRPRLLTPMAARSALRPVATSRRSPLTFVPSSKLTLIPSPSRATPSAFAPVPTPAHDHERRGHLLGLHGSAVVPVLDLVETGHGRDRRSGPGGDHDRPGDLERGPVGRDPARALQASLAPDEASAELLEPR